MSKIICDVCGTRYPENAEKCPICGRARDGGNSLSDEMLMDDLRPGSGTAHVRGGRFSKSNVRKRNENMAHYELPEQSRGQQTRSRPQSDNAYGMPQMEPEQKSGTGLNIALVAVVIALLCVTAYIFVKFFVPNVLKMQEPTVPTALPTEVATEAPTTAPTEEPTVPCEDLAWANGDSFAILEQPGQQWLLNVAVTPEDTTDQLTYHSSDEGVVTVDSEGCVTAVGAGQAVITVSCGAQQLEFDVLCTFDDTVSATEEETVPETTKPLKDVTLTVNLTDVTFNAKDQGYTFKCNGLSGDEVTWISEDENIVTVKDGKAISVGRGTTNIIAQYGDQKVTIIVRCDF